MPEHSGRMHRAPRVSENCIDDCDDNVSDRQTNKQTQGRSRYIGEQAWTGCSVLQSRQKDSYLFFGPFKNVTSFLGAWSHGDLISKYET